MKNRVRNILITSIAIVLFTLQFFGHGKIGDDWPNSQKYSAIYFRYGEFNFENFLNEVQFGIDAWIKGQGRFFPVNVFTDSAFQVLFRTDNSRNFVHFLIYISFLSVWATILYKITKQRSAVSVFLFAILATTRFRWDFDPHIGFGNILPLTLLFIGLAVLSIMKSIDEKKRYLKLVYSFLAGLSYSCSLMTYELGLYLLPGIVLTAIAYAQKFRVSKRQFIHGTSLAMPLIVATLAYINYVFRVLRPASNPSGAYVIGFDIVESSRIFFLNFLAPFPLLTFNYSKLLEVPQSASNRIALLVASITFLFYAQFCKRVLAKQLGTNVREISTQDLKNSRLYFVLPLSMVVAPAFMIALQPSWWERMKWGNSYLGIIMQELGLSLIISLLLYFIWKKVALRKAGVKKREIKVAQSSNRIFHRRRKAKDARIVYLTHILINVLLVSAILNYSNNLRFVEASRSREVYSKVWQGVISEGTFFSNVRTRDIFISETYNDAYDINAGDLFIRSNVRLAGMLLPTYLWSNYEECRNIGNFTKQCSLNDISNLSQRALYNAGRGVVIDGELHETYPSEIGIMKIIKLYDSLTKAIRKQSTEVVTKDWFIENSQPGAITSSKFWYFNLFLLTPDVGIVYLFPLVDSDGMKLDLESGKIYQVSLKKDLYYKIALNEKCLRPKSKEIIASTEYGDVYISKWGQNGTDKFMRNLVDPRELKWGTC